MRHIQHPEPVGDPTWNYVVLTAAALFEGTSFAIALRQFRKEVGTRSFWHALHGSKDPTIYTVLAEDSAALLGLLIAATGIYLSHRLQMPVLDGVASLAIGILLAGVAVLLVRESRGLLIGEGVRPETARAIRAIALEQAGVYAVGHILSMYMGPSDVLAVIDLDFEDGTSTENAAAAVVAIEARVRARFPMIKRLYIEAGAATPGTSALAGA